MSKIKSIWSQADKFLTLARKILVNTVTAILLIVFTFAINLGQISGVGSMFIVLLKKKLIRKTKFYGLNQLVWLLTLVLIHRLHFHLTHLL